MFKRLYVLNVLLPIILFSHYLEAAPVRQVQVMFLNGNSDLIEAIKGETEFARRVYGSTNMDEFRQIQVEISLSNGEKFLVTPANSVHDLSREVDSEEMITFSAKVNAFDRQGGDHFRGTFTDDEKFITEDSHQDGIAFLRVKIDGPFISFNVAPHNPVETESVIMEDRQGKLEYLDRNGPLKKGMGFGGRQINIPFTPFEATAE